VYFWNINKLKQQLIETGLTEKQLFYYLLIFIAVMIIGLEAPAFEPYESNFWGKCEAISSIVTTIVGTITAFHVNGGDSGVKFAERYFSIGFVISIRFIIFLIPMIPVAIISYYLTFVLQYGWIEPNVDVMFPDSENVTEFVLISIWEILLYVRIVKHIGDVARTKHDSKET
jgi:hypothetical protein